MVRNACQSPFETKKRSHEQQLPRRIGEKEREDEKSCSGECDTKDFVVSILQESLRIRAWTITIYKPTYAKKSPMFPEVKLTLLVK
jgi:hypothetical protein